MKQLRIALCGCQGHIEKFGNLINSYEESKVVALWDTMPGRGGEAIAERLGCTFELDYEKLLDGYDLDGVCIIAENYYHKELIIKAAERGISVFVEKPLCVDPEDAYEIQRVIHRTGVKFYMTDPFVRPSQLYVKKLIDSGTLGKITGARIRLGTCAAIHPRHGALQYDKKLSGGGIMADVGGHTIHIAHYFFGKPERISSILTYNTDQAKACGIEENAVVVMQYPDDKLVTLECSWVSGGETNTTEVFGTEGFARITKRGEGPTDELVTWQIGKEAPQEAYGDMLPENPKRHVRYFVEMMAKDLANDIIGKDPLSNSGVSIDNAVEFVEIIDAIYRSANTGLVTPVNHSFHYHEKSVF